VFKLISVLTPAAVLLVACSGAAGEAAVVNGESITVDEVEAMRVREGEEIPPDQFAADLTAAIVEVIALQAAAEEFEVTPDDAAAEARLDELEGEIEAQGQTLEEVLTAQSIPEERAIEIARLQVLRQQVLERLQEDEEVAEADIVAAYRMRELGAIEVCAHHLLVETEEEANQAIERIEDGEDFEEVAADVSTDPGAAENSGDLGCQPASSYVLPFAEAAATAEIGELTDPVQTDFGYHVIRVDERSDLAEVPPLEDVRGDIETQIRTEREGPLFEEWLQRVVQAAEVEVDEEYGTWSADPAPQVTPPAGEEGETPVTSSTVGGPTGTTVAPTTSTP
jgi:foldase protein PrsA